MTLFTKSLSVCAGTLLVTGILFTGFRSADEEHIAVVGRPSTNSFRILLRKTTFGVSMVKAFLLRNGEERRCRRQFSVGKFLTEQKS